MVKNYNLNLYFGDDGLKEAIVVCDDEPDGIIHEHDNLSIKTWSIYFYL